MKKNILISLISATLLSVGMTNIANNQGISAPQTVQAAKQSKSKTKKALNGIRFYYSNKGKRVKKTATNKISPDGFEQAETNPTYNAPSINNFDTTVKDQFKLEGYRWKKLTITYNLDNVDQGDLHYAERVIQQINNLHIVKLVPTKNKAKANITMAVESSTNDQYIKQHDNIDSIITGVITGATKIKHTFTKKHKNLSLLKQAHCIILTGRIQNWLTWEPNLNYQSAIMPVMAHEIGHALGLDHSEETGNDIMAAYSPAKRVDNDNDLLDSPYKQNLAVLYEN
ncbi:matrixin family metalloprotease [Lactobacillus bombicola]|uniref:Peptidase M10 metallopeptidase domain-containing protein n=1 Tax=Lactobacillus bombicola TaxID=1505723 RepID=A0A396ST27_9LACO|nr:matrixin family metalloprotease [Lactobacillus bombicola]RHW55062.1 hypothetical protein DS835_01425 [Lactobacillus bombicola]